jgi:hypothetical protein
MAAGLIGEVGDEGRVTYVVAITRNSVVGKETLPELSSQPYRD